MEVFITFILICLGTLMFITLYGIRIYNKIVCLDNEVKNAFSQIDIQLKRRYDLIPNLVETVKGYVKHEHDTLTDVINARNAAISANARYKSGLGDINGVLDQSNVLNDTLGKLMVVVESYPELKANEQYNLLIEELSSTENKISYSRQGFNDAAMFYNNAIQVFPASIIAGITHKQTVEYLESITDDAEREPVKVKF